jgi:hypothetical protein
MNEGSLKDLESILAITACSPGSVEGGSAQLRVCG